MTHRDNKIVKLYILFKKTIILCSVCWMSTLFLKASQILPLIEKAYNKPNLIFISKLGGFSSNNFLLQQEQKHYILKKIAEKDIKNNYTIPDIAKYINKCGLPAPHFFLTNENTYFFKYQENHYLFYERIEGRNLHGLEFQQKSLEESAHALVKLHKALPPTFLPIKEELSYRGILDTYQKLKSLHVLNEHFKIIEQSLNYKVQAIKKINLQKEKQCKKKLLTFVHGDFHNENILFSNNHSLIGILDFDKSHIGNGIKDVFHFIRLACCNNGFTSINVSKACIFSKEYFKKMNHSLDEIENAYNEYLTEQLSSSFFENLFLESQDILWLEFIERDLKNFDFLINSKEKFLRTILP